jgi:charged multivesicular body protein 3
MILEDPRKIQFSQVFSVFSINKQNIAFEIHTMFSFLYAKKVPLKDRVKKWKRDIKRQSRTIDREIKSIKRQEKECIRNIQKLAKKYPGDKSMFTPLAKQLVRTRKTVSRMMTTKAQLNSVSMTISQQYASIKIGEVMQKSTSVQKHMNAMLKLPQMRKNLQTMAREMEKAGLIEEMASDMMDEAMGTEDEEELADAEVQKVFDEIAAPIMKDLVAAPTTDVKVKVKDPTPTPVADTTEEEALSARLEQL